MGEGLRRWQANGFNPPTALTPALSQREREQHKTVELLFFFTLVVQISDVLQYVFGKLFGRTKLAPRLSPSKTWEGLIGGGVSWARHCTP